VNGPPNSNGDDGGQSPSTKKEKVEKSAASTVRGKKKKGIVVLNGERLSTKAGPKKKNPTSKTGKKTPKWQKGTS